jgi:hypothetical protein
MPQVPSNDSPRAEPNPVARPSPLALRFGWPLRAAMRAALRLFILAAGRGERALTSASVTSGWFFYNANGTTYEASPCYRVASRRVTQKSLETRRLR